MARGRGGKGLALVVLVVVCGIGTSVLLLVTLTSQDTGTSVPGPDKAKTTNRVQPDPTQPRRLVVAGSDGYAVVMNPDGSSYLEAPDGKQTQLTEPGRLEDDAAEKAVARKLEEVRPKKQGLGQLVVTDTGIVDIPRDAVVTLIGRDKVVTHEPDGTSRVYFVDGRVVPQARGDKSGRNP